jgi:hypothetical protein
MPPEVISDQTISSTVTPVITVLIQDHAAIQGH